MSNITEAQVKALLSRIADPHTGQDLSAAVKSVGVDGDKVAVDVVLPYPAKTWFDALAAQVRAALHEAGISQATVSVSSRVHAHRVQKELTPLPN